MQKIELEKKYNMSRINLLLLIILSVVNIITIVTNGSYFLFSLSFPRFVQYVIEFAMNEGGFNAGDLNYPLVIIIMALPIVLFLLCYVFSSRNRYKVFIFTIILFTIDSIFALITFDIIDIVFHIYIYVLLVMGFVNGRKIEKFKLQEAEYMPFYSEHGNEESVDAISTQAIRSDAPEGRVLIKTNYEDLEIIVKRRKGLTELIINNNVYDEFIGRIETAYNLQAVVNNVEVIFLLDRSRMEIYTNGNLLTKKIRWI